MKEYGTFDIESNKWTRFEMLGAFTGKEYRLFRRVGDFVAWLDNKRFDGWQFWAHNGGKFDFLFLYEALFNKAKDVRLIERGGRVIACFIQFQRSKIQLCDSYALLPASLRDLTKSFDVEHKKKSADFEKGVSIRSAKDRDYLANDCIGLYEVLEKFFSFDFIHNRKLSIASQALDTWRYHFIGEKTTFSRIRMEDSFRESFYSGGRCEVYQGMGQVNYYDVNSLYPFVMLSPVPCGNMSEVRRFHKNAPGFYSVHIDSMPEFVISPFLVKTQKGNYYVTGKGDYFLSSATLAYLQSEYGIRFKVNYGYVFSDAQPIFESYVRYFYELKEAHAKDRDALYYLAKFFMNSLYGKLGMSRHRDSITLWHKNLKTHAPLPGGEEYGLVLVTETSKSRFVLPYIAAWVTDSARLVHWKYLQEAGEANVFYCDTDSILCSGTKLDSHVSMKLGDLKKEGNFSGVFISPKTYALKRRNGEEKIVFKGFSSSRFTFNKMKRFLLSGGSLESNEERVLSFRECLTFHKTPKSKREIVHTNGYFLILARIKKKVVSTYDKRRIFPHARRVFVSLPLKYSDVRNVVQDELNKLLHS